MSTELGGSFSTMLDEASLSEVKSEYETVIDRSTRSNSTAGIDTRTDWHSGLSAKASTQEVVVFPESAPVILPNKGLHIPANVWECVYTILRESYEKSGDGKGWTPVHLVQIEFARRMGRPLSTEYLKRVCGIRSYKQFFVDNPWTDFKITDDGTMQVRLTRPTRRSKSTIGIDVHPRKSSKKGSSKKEEFALDDYEELLQVPIQPRLPAGLHVPQGMRERIYTLLWSRYRSGTDICTFSEGYSKRYGTALAPVHECLGINSTDYLFRCIGDIVQSEVGPDRILLLKPVDYEEVRKRCEETPKKTIVPLEGTQKKAEAAGLEEIPKKAVALEEIPKKTAALEEIPKKIAAPSLGATPKKPADAPVEAKKPPLPRSIMDKIIADIVAKRRAKKKNEESVFPVDEPTRKVVFEKPKDKAVSVDTDGKSVMVQPATKSTIEKPNNAPAVQSTVASPRSAILSFRQLVTKEIIGFVSQWPDGISVDNLTAAYARAHPKSGIGQQHANQILRILQSAQEVDTFRTENGVWCVKPKCLKSPDKRSAGDNSVTTINAVKEQPAAPTSDTAQASIGTIKTKSAAPSPVPQRRAEPMVGDRQRKMSTNGNGTGGTPMRANIKALQSIIKQNLSSNARLEKRLGLGSQANFNGLNAEGDAKEKRPVDDLYEKVYEILSVNKTGIRVIYLDAVYEGCFGERLNVEELGFGSINAFLLSRPDLYSITEDDIPGDRFVFAVKLSG